MSGVKSSLLSRAGHFLHRFLSEVTASVIVTASIAGATTAYLHYSNNQPTAVAPMAPAVLASAPASAPAAPAKPAADLSGMLSPVVADPSLSQLQPMQAGKPLSQAQPPAKPVSSSQWRKKVVAVLAKTARKPETTGSTDPLISSAPAATPLDRTLTAAAPRPAPAPQPAPVSQNEDDAPLLPPGLVPQVSITP